MFISVDVGGTNTRVAGAKDLTRPVFVSEPVRRRNTGDFETDMRFIVETARSIAGAEKLEAVGIGSTGTLDHGKSQILQSYHNPHWTGRPIRKLLERELGCGVVFENDAVCAGLGEARYGIARGDFAYIVWGTGVGGVLMKADTKGIGFTDVNEDWETYFGEWGRECGGSGLVEKYGKATQEFTTQEWKDVLERFYTYVRQFSSRTRQAKLVLGGGLSAFHAGRLEAMSAPELRLQRATYGEDAGLYGGFALLA